MINKYRIKVCGITDENNFSELKKYQIDYFGFIFYKKSPRYILNNPDHAFIKNIKNKVAVFVDENIDIWSQLNGPYWYLKTPALKTGVRVLTFAESEDAGQVPMITQQFAGAGRVVFHGFDSSWRWHGGNSDDPAAPTWAGRMHQEFAPAGAGHLSGDAASV